MDRNDKVKTIGWRLLLLYWLLGGYVVAVCGQTAYEHLEQGNRFYEEGDFLRALYEYEQGIGADTVSDPHFYVLAGTSAERVKQYERAVQLYEMAIKKGVMKDMPYRIYHVYCLMGEERKAESVLLQAVADSPEEAPRYRQRLLEHYMQHDEDEKVVTVCEQLLETYSGNSELKRTLAHYHHRLAHDSCTADICKELIEKEGDTFDECLFLGCYYRVKATANLKAIDDSLMSAVSVKTHMDYARLYKQRHILCETYLVPALHYLNRAWALRPSNALEQSIIDVHKLLVVKERRFKQRSPKK